jgi:hypothetical protein
MRNIFTSVALSVVVTSAMAGWHEQRAALTTKYCSATTDRRCESTVFEYTKAKDNVEKNSSNTTWAIRVQAFEACIAEGARNEALINCFSDKAAKLRSQK